jgi:uncharacterized protein YndB with AHSA1/START domain
MNSSSSSANSRGGSKVESMPIGEIDWLKHNDDQDRLEIVASFPKRDPDSLFRFWVEPDLLCKWWPPKVEVIEPRVDGQYVLVRPNQNWRFRIRFTGFVPVKVLGFTWNWEHEPDANPTRVHITFESMHDKGTRMILIHSGYIPNNENQRQSHLEGWIFFLSRLHSI